MNENTTNEFSKESVNLTKEALHLDEKVQLASWHSEKARMTLAYWVLGGIFSIFLLAILCSAANHLGWFDCGTGNALLELSKTGLLPIVTLILGYYFSKANND